MKKSEVNVGETYRAKVSGSVVDVRITGQNPHGGWDAVNALTNRKVRIKSAQRLRCKTPARPAKRKKIVTLAEYEAEAKQANGNADKAALAKKATQATARARKAHTGERRGKGAKQGEKKTTKKRPSGLDVAAKVLADAKQPLGAKEIVERMLSQGLWETKGQTPAATIYAAVVREIATKGDAARFRKVARGKFESAC